MDRVLLLFEGGSSLLVYTITVAYYALIFGGVVTLISLILQWRFFVWVMASKRVDSGLFRRGATVTKLEDLIGIDEAKASIMEIVDFLHDPDRYRAIGCEVPRGVLLVGSPGVGKTTLAKAMANEAGVPFVAADAASLDEVFFGIGALRIRSLFKRCRKLAGRNKHRSAVLFLDEIDALGTRNRGFSSVAGMSSGNTTLNRILTEMDGLDSTSNVIVLAATNYEEMLDPALLRPGRFDRKLYVPVPNLAARKRLFAHYLGKITSRGANLDTLAQMTVNFAGADVKAAVNEAALLCVKLRASEVTQEHLEAAVQMVAQQSGDRRPVSGGMALSRPGDLTVRMTDIIGADQAKRECQQIIGLLRNAGKLAESGARMTRGLLLLGPPGTGKTMLAKAIANEAGVPFYSVSGADFIELYVGMGAHRVRSVYAQARKHKAAIVFIDELDAVGARTGAETGAGGGGDREYNQTINQLLVELDGFGRSSVLTIGATNFEESLDAALLRPGRFDRRVYVPLPDVTAREGLFKHYLAKVKHENGINEAALAAQATNFSGADIAQVVNGAALHALQDARVSTTNADLEQAVLRERAGLGSRAIGSSAMTSRTSDISVKIADVIGIEEAKREALEVVELLRNPERAQKLGLRPPRGLLFTGPPGTGKTMLAQAMANEANVPFFSLSGSDFQSVWRGEPARRIRAIYTQARRQGGAIVFIDEIDAIGAARSSGATALRDDNTTVDALLVEMDGFGHTPLLTIGATNNPLLLDAALMRPGRFDRVIAFNLPNREGRRHILASHLAKLGVAPGVEVDVIARASTGMSPAQLMNITREAGMLALRSGDEMIRTDHLVRGLERVAIGLDSGIRLSGEERRIVAYHECGHAIAAMAFDPKREVRKVSILGTHGNLGYTWGVPVDEWHLRSEDEYLSSIKIALGGLAAERVVFGTATDGSRGDLQAVGDIVQRMVCELGMGGVLHAAPPASEALRQHQDQEMRRLSDSCFADVTALLQSRRSLLDRMAAELIASEMLTGDDLQRLGAAS